MQTCGSNYFAQYDWKTMMSLNPWPENPSAAYDIKKYHKILSPQFPDFLKPYLELPCLKRLKGIGLLCGTDWTKLYKNRFYYSRFDHSVGVALIIWHFTHNKKQTLAGLFHDISTSVFSHVSDFRKGDALTQTVTEQGTSDILQSDLQLAQLLAQDGLTPSDIENYHLYPVADNEIPRLSADRLEYMFPSGMALDGSWDLPSIERAYHDISIMKNEDGLDELGFNTLEIAEDYCRRFCMIGHILQLNENKLTLHLLGQIMNMAVEQGILNEDDFMNKSERDIMDKLEGLGCGVALREPQGPQEAQGAQAVQGPQAAQGPQGSSGVPEALEGPQQKLAQLYKTFCTMTKIEHTDKALPTDEYFCVSLKVKQRYIDPLVVMPGESPFESLRDHKGDIDHRGQAVRLSQISPFAHKIIQDFLEYKDTAFGCVKLK